MRITNLNVELGKTGVGKLIKKHIVAMLADKLAKKMIRDAYLSKSSHTSISLEFHSKKLGNYKFKAEIEKLGLGK